MTPTHHRWRAGLIVAIVLGACGGAAPNPTAASTTSVTGASTTTTLSSADRLAGFPRITVLISGRPWEVAVADTRALRDQGLMGVTDLGDLDGMFFVFDDDTEAPFWMKDTLIPLDIAFFSSGGALVDLVSMEPCVADPCPTYAAAGPYRYAVEAAAGAFDAIDVPSLALTEG